MALNWACVEQDQKMLSKRCIGVESAKQEKKRKTPKLMAKNNKQRNQRDWQILERD